MRSFRHLLPIAAALALPLAARAQDSTTARPAPDVGARVLVTLANADGYGPSAQARTPVLSPRLTGRVVQVTAQSLWVQLHPTVSAVAVPRGAVRRLYVSRGRPLGPALGWGAANGTLLGVSMGVGVAYPGPLTGDDRRDRPEALALYALSGALTGMLMRYRYPAERWREVR